MHHYGHVNSQQESEETVMLLDSLRTARALALPLDLASFGSLMDAPAPNGLHSSCVLFVSRPADCGSNPAPTL